MNTKIGPVLEATTSYLQGKYGVEIRIESLNKVNSYSWVRISHGLNKLVTDLSNKEDDDNEQETSEMKLEEFAMKTNVLASASRSKAKAKPRRRTSACSSARTAPIGERKWTDIEQQAYSPIAYPVSKQLSTLLRHGPKGGGNKKRFQYCTDPSGQEILYLRALQNHSGRNPIDPSLQNNVLIPDNFFEHIYHTGCANNLHSITNSGLISGEQNLSKRQTVFFTSVDPMNKEHRDPNNIDLEAPRLA